MQRLFAYYSNSDKTGKVLLLFLSLSLAHRHINSPTRYICILTQTHTSQAPPLTQWRSGAAVGAEGPISGLWGGGDKALSVVLVERGGKGVRE